jgi:xanthosine utilization system XapX-like protein
VRIVLRPSDPRTAAVAGAVATATFAVAAVFVLLANHDRAPAPPHLIGRVGLLTIFVAAVAAWLRARDVELVVTEEAVHVKNFFRRRCLAWREITCVTWDYDPFERFVRPRNAAPRLRFEGGGGAIRASASGGEARWIWRPRDMTEIHAIHALAVDFGIPSSLDSFPDLGPYGADRPSPK